MLGFNYIKEILFKNEKIIDNQIDELEVQEPEVDNFDPSHSNYTIFNDDFQKSESISELLQKYRIAAENSEVENAIDEICNETIINENKKILDIDIDNTKFSDNIKSKINDEFQNILKIMNFNNNGYDIFKQWFIEGRIYIYLKINQQTINQGIIGYEVLIPENIKKIKNSKTGEITYIYENNDKKYKIDQNLMIFVHSGITDPDKKYYISYLHKSLKPLNQLRLLEDSTIIYRITRAPERRVFYIDVGKLSKIKAEAYIQKMINRFKNKISYDIQTGKVTNQKNVMTMLEDFYFPVTEGGRGTKVDTLDSGQQLTDMQDIFYFKKKLYKSLKIPLSRTDDENSPVIDMGRVGETTREELKFSKFISRLKNQFSLLFIEILKRQLIWKKIIDKSDWSDNYQDIFLKWNIDSYFAEIKKQEILTSRLDIIEKLSDHIGKYFSQNYIRKNILKLSDQEIETMKKEMDEEIKNGEINNNDGMDE